MPPKPVALERQAGQMISPDGSSKSSIRTTPPEAIVDQVGVGSSTSPPTAGSPSNSENFFDLKVGATVSLNRDVAVQVGSHVITLAGGHRMTFPGREGRDAARIRYAGPTTSCHFPPFGPHDNDPSKAGETVGIEVRTSTHVNICFSMLSLREKRDSLQLKN